MIEKIKSIFAEFSLPLGVAPFREVNIRQTDVGYKTVLMTYIPYFYHAKKDATLCLYSTLPDYHDYFKEKLEPVKNRLGSEFSGFRFDIFADNSPINEKKAAIISGLGSVGKNSLLITEKHGSFVVLGEILTDLEVTSTAAEPKDVCKSCDRCAKACPAGAIRPDRTVDIDRCLSAITQKKGELSAEEAALLEKNGLIWGCDCCQSCCPHNLTLKDSEYGASAKKIYDIAPDEIENLSDREFKEKYRGYAFTWRGKNTILRNIKIVNGAKNSKK